MKGITFNGGDIKVFIEKEILNEIAEVYITENKVSLYRNPRKSNWTPNKLRSSKVRKIEVNNA